MEQKRTDVSPLPLIKAVRKHEILYRNTHPDYKDKNLRSAAWENISRLLGVSADACKEDWTKLRNSYTSAIKRREKKHDIPEWRYEKYMSFVKDFIAIEKGVRGRHRIDNSFLESDEDEKSEHCSYDEDDSEKNTKQSQVKSSFDRSSAMFSSKMDQLIEAVREHPVLYDNSVSNNMNIRTAAWEEIAQVMDATAEDCKFYWAKLRNRYAGALKRRKLKSYKEMLPWRYEKQMAFIKKFRTRSDSKQENNSKPEYLFLENDDSVNDVDQFIETEDNSTDFILPFEGEGFEEKPKLLENMTRRSTNSSSDNLYLSNIMCETNNDNIRKLKKEVYQGDWSLKDMDENDLFFISMCKSLKKLPKPDQFRIKMELLKSIQEAEMKNS